MATKVCKHYCYGHCNCRSGYFKDMSGMVGHVSMACKWETKEGFPSAIMQSRHCEDYEPMEEQR